MSSTGHINVSVGSEPSRRSTRERKQVEHFGHSEPTTELEELIEAPKPRKTAPAVQKAGKRASGKPSLWVKLPLPTPALPQAPFLPSSRPGTAPEVKAEDYSEGQGGPSSDNTKKRSAALIDDDDESELFTPSSSREQASKRPRLQPSASKPRATPKAKTAVKSGGDNRREPRGQPEVWAEVRQALCEALPYYQAYQSGAYSWGSEAGKGGYVYGFLLDNDNDERGYMDEKVVITRTGGGVKINVETGHMEQMDDQSSDSSRFTIFSNNQREMVPIILIVGAKNEHCATRVPHRYKVLGTFHVTDSWSERVKGKTVCRVRFDMLDLKASSWWGVKGSPSPAQKPDYKTKALVKTCSACGTSSKQRYAPGWMCSNDKCAEFSKINRQAVIEPPAFNQVFIDERNRWPRHIKAPFPLKPAPPTTFLNNPEMGTSLSAWKGMWEEPVERTKVEFHGYWRKATYELFPGNFITHYFANQQINRQPGGADEALEALQGTKMGLKRHPLENSPVEGEMLTRHFGINYGLPYKFVAAPDSKGFSEAPPAILDALNHLTWAGQDAIQDGSYKPFNELLCLGYMENQKIGMHDDGEEDLGPDIASWSLGGAASMDFKIKSKHWMAKDLTADTYNPELWVLPGSQAWKMRIAANAHYKAGRIAEFETAKAELFKFLNKDSEKRRKNGPMVLTLELRHGDIVVMHGERIQEIYEHAVKPKGKLRFGLTGRYIKPEDIPVEEHWKGEFSIPPEKVYDGDLALFRAHFSDEEEEEEEKEKEKKKEEEEEEEEEEEKKKEEKY
ncbi:MAG: hypothetical protein Q9161_000499 [Pseudevernia consocians]